MWTDLVTANPNIIKTNKILEIKQKLFYCVNYSESKHAAFPTPFNNIWTSGSREWTSVFRIFLTISKRFSVSNIIPLIRGGGGGGGGGGAGTFLMEHMLTFRNF